MTNNSQLFFIAFNIVTLICNCYSKDKKELRLPNWFWETPETPGVLYAVGYSDPYEYAESSFKEAFDNAAERLWYDQNCRIINKMISMDTPGFDFPAARVFKIKTDTSGLADFKRTIYHLDSLYTKHIVVVLVGTATVKIKSRLMVSPSINEVDLNERKNQVSATMYTDQYAFETSSWMELEAECRRKLANIICTELSNQRIMINEAVFSTTDIKTDIILSQIQTIGRAVDKNTGARWIKVSVPISYIRIPAENPHH